MEEHKALVGAYANNCCPVSKAFYVQLHMYVLCVFLQPVGNADFVIPVEIDGTIHQVATLFQYIIHSFFP